MTSWNQLMQNPQGIALKRFLLQILNHKITNYDDLLTRIGASLVTEKDMQLFGELVNDILEAGYKKAVEDYREKLKPFNIQVDVTKNSAQNPLSRQT